MLRQTLRDRSFELGGLQNQYFRRLVLVILDPNAGVSDKLMAYRDALMASGDPDSARLAAESDWGNQALNLKQFGLSLSARGEVTLTGDDSNRLDFDLDRIYSLDKRRFLYHPPMDPSLKTKLQDPDYHHYNGVAQRLAVRLGITARRDSTFVINLPTGCGKTLVAHAVSLFASQNQLTVIIVPTIALAIEQGQRAADLLRKAGRDHGGGYCWHGQQTKVEHDDIKARIRDQRQNIIFCSPEAACRSLLPTLFAAAKNKSLSSIVIDEAHVVDQWGAEFRPYFQILASLVRALRSRSDRGLNCFLMSATFTQKSLQLVEDLFGVEGQECIHINGSYLRPEIQFAVERIDSQEHQGRVIEAVVKLPKPLIVYTITREGANSLYQQIRTLGCNRVRLFTGETNASEREEILKLWSDDQLDVIFATSAFGLGMDKANVRSVLHAEVPENLDRFYQEAGRAGRDGIACQSLVIYSSNQIDTARRINNQNLITVKLGLEKWKTMWDNGTGISGGRRKVPVTAIRSEQQYLSSQNEEWNWRTLLLMQRTGLINIDLEAPNPPQIDGKVDVESYQQQLRDYYDDYYKGVLVTPIRDDHLSEDVWGYKTRKRRQYEIDERAQGLIKLLEWIRKPQETSLCSLLTEYYTLDGRVPEYSCGGCPHCRLNRSKAESLTVGKTVFTNAPKSTTWLKPLVRMDLHASVYFTRKPESTRRLVQSWKWLVRLVEAGAIQAISAEPDVLKHLESMIPNAFWIGDTGGEDSDELSYWPHLVMHLESNLEVPDLGWPASTRLLMAPDNISDSNNPNRRWWESVSNSIEFKNFIDGFDYGNN